RALHCPSFGSSDDDRFLRDAQPLLARGTIDGVCGVRIGNDQVLVARRTRKLDRHGAPGLVVDHLDFWTIVLLGIDPEKYLFPIAGLADDEHLPLGSVPYFIDFHTRELTLDSKCHFHRRTARRDPV